jgi:sterol-4alpha-carboxylate 3-dehydrogenase (decarboxylating)
MDSKSANLSAVSYLDRLPASALKNLKELNGKTVVVTGGCGFVGRHIVEQLLSHGCKVRVFDLFINEEYNDKVKFVKGNLLDEKDVDDVCAGAYAVIHVASPSPLSRNKKLFYDVNVGGSKNVIAACRRQGVTKLVYTSSASVQFDGTDQKNHDEQTPLPSKPMDMYTGSKLAAEQEILAAANDTLATCALRPHGIFGPRDPHFFPALAKTGKAGKSKFMIGDGSNLVDFTYVGNVAFAHILAAASLTPKSAANGKAYFITNREPILFWDMLETVQRDFGYKLPKIVMPVGFMLVVAVIAEFFGRIFKFQPTFNNQSVTYAGRHHYYSSDAAHDDFGYQPIFTLEEGIRSALDYFKDSKNPTPLTYTDFASLKDVSGVSSLRKVAIILACILVAFFASPWSDMVASWLMLPSRLSLGIALVVFVMVYLYVSAPRPKPFTEDVNLKGQTVVVSGGNKGIGLSTAIAFGKRGARVIIACRNVSRAKAAVDKIKNSGSGIKADYVLADFASFKSIADCVESLRTMLKSTKIDFLINNAGMRTNKQETEDGHDLQFQVNHLSHYLLTRLLLKHNVLSSHARIVQVSSVMHEYGHVNFSDLDGNVNYNADKMYAATKLQNVLFAKELHRQLVASNSEVRINAVHPGAVATDFINHFIPGWLMCVAMPFLRLFIITADESANTLLYTALHSEMYNVGGQYIANSAIKRPATEARDPTVARMLWKESEKLVAEYL